ncbi:MAG TPA: hypothetical protein VF788_00995 [Pseudonocardiaceae bacterium]
MWPCLLLAAPVCVDGTGREVWGCARRYGDSPNESAGQPGDNDVVMPLNAAGHYIFGGGDKLNQIIVQASQTSAVPAVENGVINVLSAGVEGGGDRGEYRGGLFDRQRRGERPAGGDGVAL